MNDGFGFIFRVAKYQWKTASLIFLVLISIMLPLVNSRGSEYEANGKLKLNKINRTSNLTAINREFSSNNDNSAVLQPVSDASNPLTTEIEVIRSMPVLQEVIEKLNLTNKDKKQISNKDFLAKLKIETVPRTDIININYRDGDARRAANVINTLMESYLKFSIQSERSEAIQARQIIENKLPEVSRSLDEATRSLATFKESHNIIDLREEATELVRAISATQRDIAAAQSKAADTEAQYRTLLGSLGVSQNQAVTTTIVNQSPEVQSVMERLRQLEVELSTEKSQLSASHPRIKDLESKVEDLRGLLKTKAQAAVETSLKSVRPSLQISAFQQKLTDDVVRLDAARQGSAMQVTTLKQLQDVLVRRSKLLPNLEKQQEQLERRLKVSQETYSLLLQRLQEIRVIESQNMGNARVLAPAIIPKDKVSLVPQYMQSVVASAFIAMLIAFLLELKSKRNSGHKLENQLQGIKVEDDKLIAMPIEALRDKVETLTGKLASMSDFVAAQEAELVELRNVVESLQLKIQQTNNYDRSKLEGYLQLQQHNYQLLNKTIEGQRQKISEQQEDLRRYQQVLQQRQQDPVLTFSDLVGSSSPIQKIADSN